jgi:tryptophan 2,3-dioxygenase
LSRTPYDLYIALAELQPLWQTRSDWEGERVLRAGFCALELTFCLIRHMAGDPRPAARPVQHLDRLWENGRRQVELIDLLLSDERAPDLVAQPAVRTNLAGLPGRHGRAYERWLSAYRALSARLLYRPGLEGALDLAEAGARYCPYDAWVAPERVAEVVARRDYNREDPLFAGVHQIAECWMLLAAGALERSLAAAAQQHWDEAASWIDKACHVLAYLTDHMELLHRMVPADYHPLRVVLRGASGSQSAQVYVVLGLGTRLAEAAEAAATPLLEVYRAPDRDPALYAYVQALADLETRLSDFFFRHYKLAARVLGSTGMGTGGYEVQRLVDRFARPFFPALDQARIAHTTWSNFAWGRQAGSLIMGLEGGAPPDGETPAQLTQAVADGLVGQYFALGEVEEWVRLFAEQGLVEDPVGSRPFVGTGELKIWRNGLRNAYREIAFAPGAAALLPDGRAEAEWQAEAVAWNGRPVRFSGTARFTFRPDGRIGLVTLAYDPQVVAAQLEPFPSDAP